MAENKKRPGTFSSDPEISIRPTPAGSGKENDKTILNRLTEGAMKKKDTKTTSSRAESAYTKSPEKAAKKRLSI